MLKEIIRLLYTIKKLRYVLIKDIYLQNQIIIFLVTLSTRPTNGNLIPGINKNISVHFGAVHIRSYFTFGKYSEQIRFYCF